MRRHTQASPGYQVSRLAADPARCPKWCSSTCRLGRLDGLDVVHLQCHIGTDTLSLARLGARSVTGLDLSPASLAEARRIATECGTTSASWRATCNAAVEALGADYDLVYTGIGALNWLPSVDRWAQVVAGLLRPAAASSSAKAIR